MLLHSKIFAMKQFICYLLLMPLFLSAQKSPFNGASISKNGDHYKFIVSGHFHGSSNNTSALPANTVLANMDLFNDSSLSMIISLGDLFLDVTKDPKHYETYFFSRLKTPLFNAVGNHDLTDNVYQEKYGNTFFYFFVEKDCHIILDTELNDSDIKGEQKEMLQKALDEAVKKSSKSIFIYGHRTIWSRNHPEMKDLFQDNTQSITGNNNFRADILPMIEESAKNAKVYLFAGSLGAAPGSFFYHKEKDKDIFYICSAIRSLNRDAILVLNSDGNGNVNITTTSLTGNKVEPLQKFNLELYLDFNPKKPFNWRLVPLYFKNMLIHRYFWYGILYTLFGVIILFMWKRFKRKKQTKH